VSGDGDKAPISAAVMSAHPIEHSLREKLAKRGRARLKREWEKASARLHSDPEGAVTAARTLLESVCKHVLDMITVDHEADGDLPKLYSHVSNALGISPSGQVSRLHRQFFGATHTIIQSVGELRNKIGDAHGKGRQSITPSRAQAELAINLAGAVANFLLSTLESHLAATRRLTAGGEAILKFDKVTVWRLVDHARNSRAHKRTWGQRRAKPALWLVGDSGIYLMSNGSPPLLRNGKIAKAIDTVRLPVLAAFADGCDLIDEVEDWWPIHNAIAGGDDFVVAISLESIRQALEASEVYIVIVAGLESYVVYSDREFAALAGNAEPAPQLTVPS
jgi:hypothetical protein